MPATIAQAAAAPGSVPIDLEFQATRSWAVSIDAARLRRFTDLEIEINTWSEDNDLNLDERIERDELRELYDKEASKLLLDGVLSIDVEPEGVDTMADPGSDSDDWKTKLSQREIDVVEQLLAGVEGDKVIAANLQIEEATVRTHRRRIAEKLSVSDAKAESLLSALHLDKPTA